MSMENTYKLAAKLLKISEEESQSYAKELAEIPAVYYSVPRKGAGSLIIDDSGECLFADSSVSPAEHVKEFTSGRRTPLSDFE